MGGSAILVKADLFAGPADVVVIPCSTAPNVTRSIAEQLQFFSIPRPTARMRLGEVAFRPMKDAASIARVAAFAASVQAGQSSTDVIFEVARRLGEFASSNNWASDVATPLLGTGAGGLAPDQAARALSEGFTQTAPDNARLRVCVLDETVFGRLKDDVAEDETSSSHRVQETKPPRVFLSYTRSSDKHAQFVLAVATKLRENGIDARLDVWHLGPGTDLAQWMCNELAQADRVLLICDDLYRQKSDGRLGGVGWEIRLVQADLMQTQSGNPDKYIPIIVSAEVASGTPLFMRGVFGYHWPLRAGFNDHEFDALLKAVYRANTLAPPRGSPPAFVLQRA